MQKIKEIYVQLCEANIITQFNSRTLLENNFLFEVFYGTAIVHDKSKYVLYANYYFFLCKL